MSKALSRKNKARRADLERRAFEKAGLKGPAWRHARNRKIAQDSRYQSAASLGHEYGLSESQINRILAKWAAKEAETRYVRTPRPIGR